MLHATLSDPSLKMYEIISNKIYKISPLHGNRKPCHIVTQTAVTSLNSQNGRQYNDLIIDKTYQVISKQNTSVVVRKSNLFPEN